ncbi:Uma2 family endonuclease [Sorangium cellulosum]|uniref:Uma2 family endonuclease n=1 Tax=Sorangium cellulosum TaxID=56 RepID=UPI001F15D2CA|nr:Uma2 family endonuclease [Sorangium cellulosum]
MSQRPYPEPQAARLLSVAEWAALPEDEAGELIDGRLVEEEMPDCVHELAVAWLIHTLRAWLFPRGGFVFGSEVKYALKPRRGRKSDVSAFLPTSRKPPARGAVAIPPDIMVEIVSPSPRDGRRDRVEKLEEYAAFGVRWYWLLDPQLRTLEIFELTRDGVYARRLGVNGGLLREVPGCDGLTLDLDALFREIDQLDATEEQEPPQGIVERGE